MAAPTKDLPRRLEYQRLDDVRPAARNPRAHDEAFLDGTITDYGFTEPALLDERTGRLVVGHGRLDALQRRKAAGQDPPEGIVVDGTGAWLLPVIRGWASRDDRHAEGYLLVSNKAAQRSGWKNDELAAMLAEYEEQVAGFALSVGFEEDEYRSLLQETGRLGDLEADFLGDLDPAADPDPAPAGAGQTDRTRTGTDVVDFRLAMSPGDRDEAVLILRREAKRLGRDTLAATLLDLLRALPAT